ncbi:hypothetical protein JW887_03175 [Candidatus Dojkabacteria bacterium]|nr:hypothetical protein [Candidatus Dojkabacteria bacterium]
MPETNENNIQITESKLRPHINNYLEYYKSVLAYEKRGISNPIKVDDLVSKVAQVYEKIRQVIDWKEEHLLRRTAIERTLKRTFMTKVYGLSIINDIEAKNIAEPIVLELIRSGHFSNNKIASSKIQYVEKCLDKYIYMLSNSNLNTLENRIFIKRRIEVFTWILEIAACEIEEILEPNLKEAALINLMTNCTLENIKVLPENGITDRDKFIQTYISVFRTLFKFDSPMISYNLLKFFYKDWVTNPQIVATRITPVIEKVMEGINNQLKYKKNGEFFKICENYDAAYLIIGDVMKKIESNAQEIDETFNDPKKLNEKIDECYKERFSTLRRRLFRSAVYSTLSILLSGIVSLIIFEIPIAQWVHGSFNPFAIIVDLIIPTILMFILVSSISLPSDKNLDRLKDEVQKIVYNDTETDTYLVNLNPKRRIIFNTIFGLFYLLGGAASLLFIFWAFSIAGVPWTSLYVDTANVAVIVFAAMIIRQRSKELTILDETGFTEFIFDIFTIPLAKIGQWFADVWKEYNFVSILFTALVDMPISTLLGIFSDWRSFIKERQSEIH